MTTYGTINVGRIALTEHPANPASLAAATGGAAGRTMTITGQESSPAASALTAAQLIAKQADVLGLADALVPVTFTDKSDQNGYYQVIDSKADQINWEGEIATFNWTIDLQRVGTDTEIDLESRLTGGTRTNSFSATGVRWHAPSLGAYGYWSGSGSSPNVLARTGSDGALNVYTALPTPCITRWGIAVGSYLNGRVRFLDANGLERTGILFTTPTNTWTLSNGLVRVSPITSNGILSIDAWTGAAWQIKNWDVQTGGVSLGAPTSISVLRNEPEIVVLRLLWSQSPGRTTADLTLRRGSRFVEFYVNAEVSATLKIVRGTPEIGVSGGGGEYVIANVNDGAANKYIVGSALTSTADTTNGGISKASTVTFDAFVGVVAGGTGAVTGDQAADLYAAYLAAPAELVQGVRR